MENDPFLTQRYFQIPFFSLISDEDNNESSNLLSEIEDSEFDAVGVGVTDEYDSKDGVQLNRLPQRFLFKN